LKVVLIKIVDSVEDIVLPLCRFQLIVRKQIDVDTHVEYCTDTETHTESTQRGSGGFGSTD
jgi:hypothetical protein